VKHAWGATAISLGTWEAVALTTRRLPTVTSTVRCACARQPAARALVLLWLAALGRHLLQPGG
jgi:hypothetical protein